MPPGYNTNVGAKRARQARERFGLDPAAPVDILALAETRAQLPVIVGALPEHIAGALWRNGTGSLIWVNAAQPVERRRFTIAHELGHACCGHDGTAVDTLASMLAGSRDPLEVQANAFAAELLAPRAAVEKLIERTAGLEQIVALAARFGISAIAALNRCTTLELLPGRRADQLRAEIAEGMHHLLGAPPFDDTLARIEDYPRIPPAIEGSGLAALLRGEVSVDAVAGTTGCDAGALAAAAAALTR